MKKAGLGFALLAVGFFLSNCSDRVAGGGTEETNGSLAGLVSKSSGAPAIGAYVYIHPSGYLMDTSAAGIEGRAPDAITDHAGGYHKDSLPPGNYLVEIQDHDSLEALTVGKVSAGSVTQCPKSTLVAGGFVEGKLKLIPGAGPSFIQVYGLNRVARTDFTGHFLLRNLPPGRLQLHFTAPAPGFIYPDPPSMLVSSADTFSVGETSFKDTAVEDYSLWPHSRKINLNTARAGITDTVSGFALLVRLDSSAFDFTASDGGDLRFSGTGGRHLPFEVEGWDPARRKAEIWVKLDTLWGSSSNHFITMYWGKTGVPNLSSGISVFTEYGGVWHMQSGDYRSGPAPDSGWSFTDASAAQSHGKGSLAPVRDSGGIGVAGLFSGNSIKVPGSPILKPTNQVTVSCWFKADTSSTDGELATMGDVYGLRLLNSGNLWFFMFTDTAWSDTGQPAPDKWTPFATEKLNLRDNIWHLAATVWDGSMVHVYVDGDEKYAAAYTGKLPYLLGKDFWIGQHSDRITGFDFSGLLDEVRMSPNATSAARLHADYLSQRPDASLLEFK